MPEQFLYPNSGAANLAAIVRTGLVAATLKLFQNPVVASPSTVLGDLTECDFSGYAAVSPVVWGASFLDPSLGGYSFSTYKQWNFDGSDLTPTQNNVYGFWLESTAGNLLAVNVFDAPVAMAAGGDALIVNPKLNF